MKKNIAVVGGGFSSEYIVSVKSADFVLNHCINTQLFTPWLVIISQEGWFVKISEEEKIEIDRAHFSFSYQDKVIPLDFAYIIIHGTPGEDGVLQGYFDLLNIPYSSCNMQSSALTFNKYYTNNFLKSFGVKVAPSIRLQKNDAFDDKQILADLGLPVFVKPNIGGSSFGVTKVKEADQLCEAIEKAFSEAPEVMIESFIDGAEFTCGMVNVQEEDVIFPVTEVIPENEFFNYESKYVRGKAQEITPARISEEKSKEIQDITQKVYNLIGCSGICRADFMIQKDEIYFLEINTAPGMTETSFIPQQVAAAGLDIKDLITKIILEKIEQ